MSIRHLNQISSSSKNMIIPRSQNDGRMVKSLLLSSSTILRPVPICYNATQPLKLTSISSTPYPCSYSYNCPSHNACQQYFYTKTRFHTKRINIQSTISTSASRPQTDQHEIYNNNTSTSSVTTKTKTNKLLRFLVAISIVTFVFNYIISIGLGDGLSMYPTLNAKGTVFLYEQITSRTRRYQRGDIIAYQLKSVDQRYGQREGTYIVKRVIGLPGDQIPVQSGLSLQEETTRYHGNANGHDINTNHITIITVPSNHLWVQGDLLDASYDSRHYGAIPMDCVLGRVCLILLPVEDMGTVERTLQYRGW